VNARPRTVLVVGAGLAGARAAEVLRAEGFEGRLVLVGEEPELPYERPALSKQLLAGTRAPEDLTLRPRAAYEERGIELQLGRRVTRIDLHARTAELAGGTHLPWDALVLATGARARHLPGPVPAGVHRLRTLADALALRASLVPGRRLAVVGAGLVGTEVASTARALGAEVTLLGRGLPLQALLGSEVGALLAERHREEGIELRVGVKAVGLRSGADGRVRSVLLADGGEAACDTVLVATGAQPAADLLGPLTTAGGIPTDACGRTAFPGVYAAGDAALPYNPWLGASAPADHWTAAAGLAAAAAHSVLGLHAPFAGPPSFWTDQVGLRLQFAGRPGPWDRVELEGSPASFAVRYLDATGACVAGLLANRPADYAQLRRELASAGAAGAALAA
jgi:NADPH-dependent 2,4-dienoyl-CoA reductase/sulfur reductase-like enzyme